METREVEQVTPMYQADGFEEAATLDDVIDEMIKIHDAIVELHLGIMKLVGWEEKKQKQKEDYWAKRERSINFERQGDEK